MSEEGRPPVAPTNFTPAQCLFSDRGQRPTWRGDWQSPFWQFLYHHTTRFILDQSGKYFSFCPLWGKRYFRFAGGKADSWTAAAITAMKIISHTHANLEVSMGGHKKIERYKEIDRRRKRREKRIKQRIKEAKAEAKKS